MARSRKRAEKGLCTKEESEAFCAKSEATLKRYLDKQVESGAITPAEAEAKSMQIRGDALKANPGLVQLEAVSKWDGKAPGTLVIGDKATPMLSLDAKAK